MRGKKTDLIGQRFGRLLVVEFMGVDSAGNCKWKCLCDCGNEKIILALSLKNGNTQSCGCMHKEQHIIRMTKHGHNKKGYMSRTYKSWKSAKERCYNKNHNSYVNYGGRGIKICERWMDLDSGFENFLEDMGIRPDKMTLDRVDNNGDYCKDNCMWSTCKSQSNNMRSNVILEYNGESKTIKQWSEASGINYSTLCNRLARGLSILSALTTPVVKHNITKKSGALITFNGEAKTLKEWASFLNIAYSTLQQRLLVGWSIERALTTPVKSRNKKT